MHLPSYTRTVFKFHKMSLFFFQSSAVELVQATTKLYTHQQLYILAGSELGGRYKMALISQSTHFYRPIPNIQWGFCRWYNQLGLKGLNLNPTYGTKIIICYDRESTDTCKPNRFLLHQPFFSRKRKSITFLCIDRKEGYMYKPPRGHTPPYNSTQEKGTSIGEQLADTPGSQPWLEHYTTLICALFVMTLKPEASRCQL
jgi:hypothetical protein